MPRIEKNGGTGSGTVVSVVAGTGIGVDNTDPANPVVSATGILTVTGGPGIGVVIAGQNAAIFNQGVLSVDAGNGIFVDNTDPQNPIVSLPTANVIQGTDTTGGTSTPLYNFAQSFTPDFRGVLVIASVCFSTGTPQDIVEVWLENDASPGVRLNSLTLQSAGDSLQSVTVQAIDSPVPTVATAYRIFASNTSGGSITVPANGASVLVSGF